MDLEDIDEIIDKLKEVKILTSSVNEMIEKEEYLTAEDVAKIMKISTVAARAYMARPDFPRLKAGAGYKVSKTAFFLYNLKTQE